LAEKSGQIHEDVNQQQQEHQALENLLKNLEEGS
jgi:hypothetical protein